MKVNSNLFAQQHFNFVERFAARFDHKENAKQCVECAHYAQAEHTVENPEVIDEMRENVAEYEQNDPEH